MKHANILLSGTALLLAASAAWAAPPHRMADTDGDGAISREEMSQMRMQMFERMDADDDGYVTAEERTAAREKMRERREKMRERRDRRQEAHFERMDADGDGRLSRQEMRDAPMPMFDKADNDGDGEISREEMRKAHPKGMHGQRSE